MTAIFGLWRLDGGLPDDELVRLSASMARYGEDSREEWHGDAVGLGRRLMARLTEDRFPQEIHEAGRRYAVVADVHLTERQDLVEQLGLGAGADTLSDAALVAAAIERWHEAAFDRIYGPFAIAAWDTVEKRLLLARDPLGDRPLFYHLTARHFAFASMPEGLQALPDIPTELDEEQYLRVLRDIPMSPGRTLQAGISRVMSGHYLIVSGNGVRSERYWRPDLTPLKLADQEDYEARLDDLFERAVAASLRGVTGEVAAHLSSGFDSTAVVSTAARQLAGRGGTVVAYTAVPRPGTFAHLLAHQLPDEGDLAALTAAQHPNIEHVPLAADRGTLDNLDRTAAIYAMPIRNLCNLSWGDAINDRARARRLRVLLQGGRGNLSISESGIAALHELWRGRRWRTWWRIARGLVSNGWMQWRGVWWNTLSPYVPLRLWIWMETRSGRPPIAGRRFSAMRDDSYDRVREQAEREHDSGDRFASFDFAEFSNAHTDSVDTRLMMVADDMGSHLKAQLGEWGLDVRDPTADRRLIEFALRVPVERLVWDGEPRAILRKVLADRVPAAILDNRKKGYQSADWHDAMARSRTQILEEVERLGMFEPTAAIVDIERLKALVEAMPEPGSPRWQDQDTELDYRYGLLRAISVGSHMRKSIRSNY